MSRILLIILIISPIIFSCAEKEEPVPEPSVETHQAKFIGDSIYFHGKANNSSAFSIVEYGFLINDEKAVNINSFISNISDSTSLADQVFSLSLLNSFADNKEYWVKAYCIIEGATYYGNVVSFNGLGMNPPEIKSFEPRNGDAGDFVKIYGGNFFQQYTNLSVFLGEYEVDVVSLEMDRLVIKVPEYRYSGEVNIKVVKGAYSVNSSEKFTLNGPRISSVSPSIGTGYIEGIIEGKNFSDQHWRNEVTISSRYSTTILSATEEQITFSVDATNLPPGIHDITVTTMGVSSKVEDAFEITSLWRRLSDKPGDGSYRGASFVISDKIYVCTGASIPNNTGGYNSQVWEYDLSSDQWSQKADFPGSKRVWASSFSINGKGYLGGGTSSFLSDLGDFWEYDPQTDQWTSKASMPGSHGQYGFGLAYNEKGYFGLADKSLDFIEYDPLTDEWTELPNFPGHKRLGAMVAVVDNVLYVIGGADGNQPFAPDIWSYDFELKEWLFVTHLDNSVHNPVLTVYDNTSCYILSKERNYLNEDQLQFYSFDPKTSTYPQNLPVFAGRYRMMSGLGVMIDGKFITGLGLASGSDFTNDIWEFDLNEYGN